MITMVIMVNMVKMITMVNIGIKDHLVTMGSAGNKVAAVTNVAITTLRQGPRPSNVASKCPPRYSLVTKLTSPPCLQRNTCDSCKDGKIEREGDPSKKIQIELKYI